MATQKEFVFVLKVETDEGVQEIKKSVRSLEEFDERINDLQKQVKGADFGSKEFRELNSELQRTRKAKQDVIDTAQKEAAVLNNTNQEVKQGEQGFIAYNRQLRQARKDFQSAFESGDEQAVRRLRNEIDDLEDKIEITTLKSKKFGDAMASIPGPVGMVGQAVQGVEKAFKVLIANPIIAIIAAIAGAFIMMKEALERTEKGQKALNKIFEAGEKIMNAIFAVIEPIAFAFAELASAILENEVVMKGLAIAVQIATAPMIIMMNVVKGLILFFGDLAKIIMNVGGAFADIGSAIGNFFTGNWSEAGDKALSAVNKIKEAGVGIYDSLKKRGTETIQGIADGVGGAQERFAEGLTRMTKKEKEAAKESAEITKQKIKEIQDAINQYNQEAEDKQEETRQKELEANRKKYQDLLKQAQQYGLDTTKLTESYRSQESEINKKWDQIEFEKQKERFEQALQKVEEYLQNKSKKFEEDRNFEYKKQDQALTQQLLDGQIKEQDFVYKQNELRKQRAEQRIQEDKDFYAQQQGVLAVSLMMGTISIEDYNKKKLELEDDYKTKSVENQLALTEANQLIGLKQLEDTKLLQQQLTEVTRAESEARTQIQLAAADVVGAIGGLLRQFAGKNKGLAKAAIIIEQGANVARMLIGSAASVTAINAQYSAIPAVLPPGIPNPAFPIAQAARAKNIAAVKIQTAIGVASAIAGAVQGISDIERADTQDKTSDESLKAPVQQKASSIDRFAKGGLVQGPGGGTEDMVPAFLSNGEFVINAQSTARFKPLLEAINDYQGSRFVPDVPIKSDTFDELQRILSVERPIKTYVVSTDMTTQQQLDRQTKNRSII